MSPGQKKTKRLEAALSHFFHSLILALSVCPLYLPPFLSRVVRIKIRPEETLSARVEATL